METPSSDILGPRLNFEFAFNDADFSDRDLYIEIMADSLDSKSDSERFDLARKVEKLDLENEYSTVAEVKTVRISSPILAANSPFFYKLFKNGMRESQQKKATLRINKSEDASLTALLNFMYSNTLTETTTPDLFGVLIIADKYEVTSCIRYCSALLQKRYMSLELALLYLELPPSVSVAELVKPLVDGAKRWLIGHFRDINKSQEVLMTLPLFALEVVLSSEWLKVDSRDDVFKFILKWARANYPELEVRREILTKRLTQFIPFQYMSCSKLKEILICHDFDHEDVSKRVLEALFFKVEFPYGQSMPLYKRQLIKVEQFELPQPRCVVYFDLKKEECQLLFTEGNLLSPSFCLGEQWFYLMAKCTTKEQQPSSFGLFLLMTEESDSNFKLDYEFAVMKRSSKEFQNHWKGNFNNSQLRTGTGYPDLFGISWTDFLSKDSEYFIDGILHLRADLTINISQV